MADVSLNGRVLDVRAAYVDHIADTDAELERLRAAAMDAPEGARLVIHDGRAYLIPSGAQVTCAKGTPLRSRLGAPLAYAVEVIDG